MKLKLYILEYDVEHSGHLVPFYAGSFDEGLRIAEEWASEHNVQIVEFKHWEHGLVIHRTKLPSELEVE